VADVAYFIGEDAPKMTGVCDPALPAGRDFDYINAVVIMKTLGVKDGRLVLPHGVSYRLLVLPRQDTMRPEVLRKVLELVKAGATVMGTPPAHSPSLEDFPQCDAEVRELAAQLWGAGPVEARGERKSGDGRMIWGMSLEQVFAETQSPPDIEYRGAAKDAKFLFTHRSSKDAEIYFVTNQSGRPEKIDGAFRVTGRQPELWDAVTGERRNLAEWTVQDGQTIVPLAFEAKQSWFIVFRQAGKPAAGASRNFPEMETVTTLEGPWNLAFDPKWGGPRRVGFARLVDWTSRPEEGIRHYSGTAVYQKSFVLPAKPANKRLFLDLGDVRDMATVRLNGRELGTVWTAPWRLDITDAAKAGANALEIAVVNPWNNRLVGDAKLPPARRMTSLSLNTVKPKSPLLPAGLLGPVSVRAIESPR
jgi:hypothetical protein